MRVPVELLVLLCLAVGLAPALVVGPLLAVASYDVLGGALPAYSLSIWHGINAPLVMSIAALAAGTALYFWFARSRSLHEVEPDGGAEQDHRREGQQPVRDQQPAEAGG